MRSVRNTIILTSAFSPGMIDPKHLDEGITACFEVLGLCRAKELVSKAVSGIGHTGTAKVVSQLLDQELKVDRTALKLQPGDQVVVFQIIQSKHKRLGEGEILTGSEIQDLWDIGGIRFILVTLRKGIQHEVTRIPQTY